MVLVGDDATPDRALAALAVLLEATGTAVVFGLVDPGPSEDGCILRLFLLESMFLGYIQCISYGYKFLSLY